MNEFKDSIPDFFQTPPKKKSRPTGGSKAKTKTPSSSVSKK